MRFFSTILIVALAASLLLAACGEDDGTDTTGADEPATATTVANSASGEANMPKQWDQPPAMQLEQGKDYAAVLHTNKGDITIDLFEQETSVTVNNFVFLAQQGFYTGVPFHRVIKGFMVQTGDPTGTGAGSPGYRFQDEPVTRDYVRGTVAMANAGPNTNGSQFFIVHQDTPQLPKNYTIFGIVTDGFDTLDAIANVPVKPSARGEMSVPSESVTLESVDITTK